MGVEVAAELKDVDFDTRFKWVLDQKAEGNKAFGLKNYMGASDIYLKTLCGMDFKKPSKTDKEKINAELKVPVLNNLALCLINQKLFARAIQMTDKVLEIDRLNHKALHRKCLAAIELSDYSTAKTVLTKLEEAAF